MSTDIKPGQVWAWNDGRTSPGPEFTITNLGTYAGTSEDRVDYAYAGEAGAFDLEPRLIRSKAHLVKDVDATPAPLDPAKVAITLKGGDYIEAESDGTKIGGKVSHVTERGFVAIEHLGEFAIHQITASPQADRYRFFILTDHQPAPEPEPVWREGIVGTATVGPKRREVRAYSVAKGAVIESVGGGYAVWNADDVHAFVPDEPRAVWSRRGLRDALTHDDSLKTDPGTGVTYIDPDLAVGCLAAYLRGESR
jgi:hypothetical protein